MEFLLFLIFVLCVLNSEIRGMECRSRLFGKFGDGCGGDMVRVIYGVVGVGKEGFS